MVLMTKEAHIAFCAISERMRFGFGGASVA
jgi:hypothetical protein